MLCQLSAVKGGIPKTDEISISAALCKPAAALEENAIQPLLDAYTALRTSRKNRKLLKAGRSYVHLDMPRFGLRLLGGLCSHTVFTASRSLLSTILWQVFRVYPEVSKTRLKSDPPSYSHAYESINQIS